MLKGQCHEILAIFEEKKEKNTKLNLLLYFYRDLKKAFLPFIRKD